MLEALERGNLFVVPLDDCRQWYRYHHLFADVLHARLIDEQPDKLRELHRRASDWYDRNGEPSEAIRHALAAADFARAADLLETTASALLRSRHDTLLLGWLQALPEDVLRCRPVLCNAYAGALLVTGQPESVEAHLQDAEKWLDRTAEEASSAGMVVVDQAEFRRLPGAIALHRAGRALLLGDVAATVSHARRALSLVSEDDYLGRGSTAALLGLAAWASGDLEQAHQSYSVAQASLRRAGNFSDVLGCAIMLADIRMTQGRLNDAMRTFEQGLELAAEHTPVLRGTADMHVGMSQVHRERNDLAAGEQHLLKSQELGEHNGLPQNRYRWRAGMARIREAHGDLDGALALLDEAAVVYTTDFAPSVRPIPALKARVWLAQGHVAEAVSWAREQGLSSQDDLSYAREFEHITLARVLLARRAYVEALELLARLLSAAEDGGRRGTVMEILVLRALAQQSQADIPAALAALERALKLAEPEGYVRIFVDEGPPLAALLELASKHQIAREYARQLLAAFATSAQRAPIRQELSEPLSERELDVLRLLGTDLDGPGIARHLVVSLSTVRTHTQNIFNKLGVNNRRAAVRRAAELDLLSLNRDR
jgi:LuxR family maltose regulon positive regulatory protein